MALVKGVVALSVPYYGVPLTDWTSSFLEPILNKIPIFGAYLKDRGTRQMQTANMIHRVRPMIDNNPNNHPEKYFTFGGWGYYKSTNLPLVVPANLLSLISYSQPPCIELPVGKVQEVVLYAKEKEKYRALGAQPPRGILLEGPPGTGKTLIAKAIAQESGCSFFYESASSFIEMYVGVGAKRIRELFEKASAKQPAIIFIDEIDAIASKRTGTTNDERLQTLNQLLCLMDGFDSKSSIIVLAATNNAQALDPAIKRSGRFDRIIKIPLPNQKSRQAILELYIKKLPSVDVKESFIEKLSVQTAGLSGADLSNLVNQGTFAAVKENATVVTSEHLTKGLQNILSQRQNRLF